MHKNKYFISILLISFSLLFNGCSGLIDLSEGEDPSTNQKLNSSSDSINYNKEQDVNNNEGTQNTIEENIESTSLLNNLENYYTKETIVIPIDSDTSTSIEFSIDSIEYGGAYLRAMRVSKILRNYLKQQLKDEDFHISYDMLDFPKAFNNSRVFSESVSPDNMYNWLCSKYSKDGSEISYYKVKSNYYMIKYKGEYINENTYNITDSRIVDACMYDSQGDSLLFQSIAYNENSNNYLASSFVEFLFLNDEETLIQTNNERVYAKISKNDVVDSLIYTRLPAGQYYKTLNRSFMEFSNLDSAIDTTTKNSENEDYVLNFEDSEDDSSGILEGANSSITCNFGDTLTGYENLNHSIFSEKIANDYESFYNWTTEYDDDYDLFIVANKNTKIKTKDRSSSSSIEAQNTIYDNTSIEDLSQLDFENSVEPKKQETIDDIYIKFYSTINNTFYSLERKNGKSKIEDNISKSIEGEDTTNNLED